MKAVSIPVHEATRTLSRFSASGAFQGEPFSARRSCDVSGGDHWIQMHGEVSYEKKKTIGK